MNQPILFKVYRNGSKIKRICVDGDGSNMTQLERYWKIKNSDLDIVFFDHRTNLIETDKRLLDLLISVEKCNDTKLLNRIIKNGGFIEYIQKLEGVKDGTRL